MFGYGGNDGDCSSRTAAGSSRCPRAAGRPALLHKAVPNGHDGAVWMGGAAPEVDACGQHLGGHGQRVGVDALRLQRLGARAVAGLACTQFFAPSDWSFDNGHDQDLGSTAPALLSNGTVMQVGKSSHRLPGEPGGLGGICGRSPRWRLCGSDVDGGDAVSGTVVYVPCGSGVAGRADQPVPGCRCGRPPAAAHGPPITAGGLVWSIGGPTLFGLNPSNGATV